MTHIQDTAKHMLHTPEEQVVCLIRFSLFDCEPQLSHLLDGFYTSASTKLLRFKVDMSPPGVDRVYLSFLLFPQ